MMARFSTRAGARALVMTALVAGSAAVCGCGASSAPSDGTLSETAQKALLKRKVDVQDRPGRKPRPPGSGSRLQGH